MLSYIPVNHFRPFPCTSLTPNLADYIFGKHVKKTLEFEPLKDGQSRFVICLCKFTYIFKRDEHRHSGQPHRNHRNHPGHVEPIASHNLTLRTLLVNHTIHAYIVQNKIIFPFPGPKKPSIIDTKIFVNRHLAVVSDIVGFNGAIHVIDKLLDPRPEHHCPGHHCRHRHSPGSDHHFQGSPFEDDGLPEIWEDWENWLPQWAEQG